jgi:acyl-CoA thioester hydrolase
MGVFEVTCRGVVYPWQCDHMGHMNVMWYVGKFDEATWIFLASIGLTPSYMREQQRGAVAVDQRLSYRRELLAGDLFRVRSAALEIGRSSIRFVHEMFHGESGELAATTILKGVHIDTRTRRPCPVPDDIRRRAEGATAPDPSRWDNWPPERAFLE